MAPRELSLIFGLTNQLRVRSTFVRDEFWNAENLARVYQRLRTLDMLYVVYGFLSRLLLRLFFRESEERW